MSFSLIIILYDRYTVEEHVHLDNRRGCNVQRSNGASPCNIENRLQKMTSIDEYDESLSNAKEGVKEFAHSRNSLAILNSS